MLVDAETGPSSLVELSLKGTHMLMPRHVANSYGNLRVAARRFTAENFTRVSNIARRESLRPMSDDWHISTYITGKSVISPRLPKDRKKIPRQSETNINVKIIELWTPPRSSRTSGTNSKVVWGRDNLTYYPMAKTLKRS